MRLDLRIALFLIPALGALAINGLPALADTNCACDNGQQVATTRDDGYACEDACSLVGADGGHPAAVDESDDDDDGVIVAPRRDRGRPGPARRR